MKEEDFLFHFKDICSKLGGKLSRDSSGHPVCYLEGDAKLEGYPEFDAIGLEKRGEIVMSIHKFQSSPFVSAVIPPDMQARLEEKGFGEHFACLTTESAEICINERGDVVYLNIL